MATRDSAYDKILAAAAKLFAVNGYAATTTRMIVAEAGSSLSAIHAHFKSKEGIYDAVMATTADTFYRLNEPLITEIRELEKSGTMTRDAAWNQIVMLTDHTIDWVYNPDYKYEILLMNQQMIGLGDGSKRMPDSFFELYRMFERLFRSYTGDTVNDWPVKLAFYTVTSAFDGANYPHILEALLGEKLEDKEGLTVMKSNLKNYLLTNMKAQLDLRCNVQDAK